MQQRWVQAKQARVVRIVKKVTTAGCWSSSRPETPPPPNHCIVGTIAPQHSAVTLWFSNLDFLCFALQCRCALMCCFSYPIISMPAMGELIQFILGIPFREINVLKTKSCFWNGWQYFIIWINFHNFHLTPGQIQKQRQKQRKGNSFNAMANARNLLTE